VRTKILLGALAAMFGDGETECPKLSDEGSELRREEKGNPMRASANAKRRAEDKRARKRAARLARS